MLARILTNFFITTWLPEIFFAVVFLIAVFLYFFRYKRRPTSFKDVGRLGWIVVLFRLLYAAFLSAGQYYIWSINEFTKLLLPPHQSLKYFFLYSWTHFWFNAVASIVLAVTFYLFLKLLKKYKERFFAEGEVELGFLCALLAGWPSFVVFLPTVFIFVILISIFRMAVFKEPYTTLGLPFLLAAAIVLAWGERLVEVLGLRVLRM